jgi:hypothetical protein
MGAGQTLLMGMTVFVSPDKVATVFCKQLRLAATWAFTTA